MKIDITDRKPEEVDKCIELLNKFGLKTDIEALDKKSYLIIEKKKIIYPADLFNEFWMKEIERKKRYNTIFSMVSFNGGNERKILKMLRESDIIGKVGDQTIVLLPNTNRAGAEVLAKRISEDGGKILQIRTYV